MDKKTTYKILMVVFGIAGLAWFFGGLFSVYHRILYPFIGLVNLGIAFYCKQESK